MIKYKSMKNAVKFATQLDIKVLEALKSYASEQELKISSVVNQAIEEYLSKYKVRPAFKQSMQNIIENNQELLKKLAE